MRACCASAVLVGLLLRCAWSAEPVQFADPDLKQAVKAALGIDHDPTPEEMLGLTRLVTRNSAIQDLHGLEYALNLTILDIYFGPDASLSEQDIEAWGNSRSAPYRGNRTWM